MAAALIDRLVHHCHIVNIRGNSFRMRRHRDLWRSLHAIDRRLKPRARAAASEGGGELILRLLPTGWDIFIRPME